MTNVTLFALLTFLFCNPIDAFIIRHNVVFDKTAEVTLTRSRWLISLVLDLSAYDSYVNTLEVNANKILNGTKHLQAVFTEDKLPEKYINFVLVASKLRIEVESLKYSYNEIYDQLKGYKLLRKRAILGFLGDIASVLFGTVSEQQLEEVKSNINHLKSNQNKIIHVLTQSLTVINTTTVQLKETRHKVNELIDQLSKYQSEIANYISNIQHDVAVTQNFIVLYTQLELAMSELQQQVLKGHMMLSHLRTQLSFMSTSKLTTDILSPKQLGNILIDIESKLPPNYKLPIAVKSGLWKYYSNLELTTILEGKHIIMLIHIPLLQYNQVFEVYRIQTLPMPHQNSTNTDVKSTMSAYYDIGKVNAIAINKLRTQYTLLSDNQLNMCEHAQLGACHVKTAVYNINLSKLCVVALFLNDKVTDNCKTMVEMNSVIPFALPLRDGLYVIVSNRPLRFAISCQGGDTDTKTVITSTPIDTIKLDLTCFASNEYLTLPGYYVRSTRQEITDSVIDELKNSLNMSSLLIWESFDQNITKFEFSKLPEKLKDWKQVPLNHLISDLKELEQVNDDLDFFSSRRFYYILIIALIIIAVILIIVYKLRHRIKARVIRSVRNGANNGTCCLMSHKRTTTPDDINGEQLRPSAPEEIPLQQLSTQGTKHIYPMLTLAEDNKPSS